jgi:HD-GYP domain-containing protein (c-di-GMP phosphodiesterase class II)
VPEAEDIRTVEELGLVVERDPHFAGFQVTARGADFVEVRVGEGGVIVAEASLWRDEAKLEPHLVRSSGSGSTLLILAGSDTDFEGIEALRDRADFAVMNLPLGRARLYVTLRNYLDLVALRSRATERGRWAERYRYELGELIAIARAISSERDIGKLLGLILEKSRYVTGADAGSVYIVEGEGLDPRGRTLRFMVSQNDSLSIDFREFTLPVDEKSIVGRAVISRQIINIPDLYQLGQEGKNPWGFTHDRSFDLRTGYQGRSMLTVPMINQRDEVIGVIQLINKRRDGAPKLIAPSDFDQWVVPFDKRAEELSLTLASQAGISLENTLLYADIQRLFEGFVNASVTAIEQRDPTTSGHSQRVATLTCGLAEMVDREANGPYAHVHFTDDDLKQIEYAGLLHDFGKVGVREKVLVKAKKLYEYDRDLVLARFDYIRKTIEAESLAKKVEAMQRAAAGGSAAAVAAVEEEGVRRLAELDEYLRIILAANEPSVLAEGSFDRIAEIASRTYIDARGLVQPYLTPSEVAALRLPRGSLTAEERLEIESHVVHTFNFLETIPWGRRFGKIPTIAGAHHEKLDGTGYPRGLKAPEIRIETRMMTIADIFDALTASDRPYKKAVPVDKALGIIEHEVKTGKCDPELFRIFVEAKVWTRVLPTT